MKHKLFNSKEEYLKWANKAEYTSDGLARKPDTYELRKHLKNDIPVKFPCITTWVFEAYFDRSGDSAITLCEHVYLAEFTEGFNPYEEEDRIEAEEKRIRPYFIASQELVRYQEIESKQGLTADQKIAKETLHKKVQRLRKKHKQEITSYFARIGYKIEI